MINTKTLKEGDRVKIWIEKTGDFEYGGEGYRFTTTAVFRNGLFANGGEVYGSSVYKFKKLK